MSRRYNDTEVRELYGRDKWTDKSYRKLVSLYRKTPCLWKKDGSSYLDSRKRHDAYNKIHRAMSMADVSFVEVMMKIRELRRMYVQELKKIFQAEATGRSYETKYLWFHDLHEFLYPYLDYEETAELHEVLDNIEHVSRKYSYEVQADRRAVSCQSVNAPNNFVNGFATADRMSIPPGASTARQQENHQCSQTAEPAGSADRTQGKSLHIDDRSFTSKSSSFTVYPPTSASSSGTLVCEKPDYCSFTNVNGEQAEARNYLGEPTPRGIVREITTDICNLLLSSTLKLRKYLYFYMQQQFHTERRNDSAVEVCMNSTDCNVGSEDFLPKSLENYDQFDFFGRSVACQLRKMDLNSALKAQTEIQRILTEIVVGPTESQNESRKRSGKSKKNSSARSKQKNDQAPEPNTRGGTIQFEETGAQRASTVSQERSSRQFIIPPLTTRRERK